MKTVICVTLLALLGCAVMMSQTQNAAQTDDSKQEKSQTHKKHGKRTNDCQKPNKASAYFSDLRIPRTDRKVKTYDAAHPETYPNHPAVCLDKKAGDTIFWLSSNRKRFKLKISPAKDQNDPGRCGNHPFVTDPPDDLVYGHYSGPLRDDAPVGCIYDVDFKFEDGKKADPHIQVTSK
jgi:Ni/Co efflux regulator RcnB